MKKIKKRNSYNSKIPPHTLKSVVFCEGGRLAYESVGRAIVCSQIILTESRPGNLLICRSLVISLLVLSPLHSGRVRSVVSCLTWTLMGALTHWVRFLFFLRELLMFWPPVVVECFGCMFVWVVSWLAGDIPMSPQFRKVDRPPLLPITDRFS